jgi:hypothetical protein
MVAKRSANELSEARFVCGTIFLSGARSISNYFGIERFVGAMAKEEPGCKYKVVEAVVDSGAEEIVASPCCFMNEVMPSRMSRVGGRYRAANGARIPNLGQQ